MMHQLKAITLRGLPSEVARALRQRAERDGASLNRTLIWMLEESLGGPRGPKRPRRHHDLDALAGAWTRQQAAAFDAALVEQRAVDPDLWK